MPVTFKISPSHCGLLLAGFLYFLSFHSTTAQEIPPEKCAIEQYEKWQKSKNLPVESTNRFEEWITRRLAERAVRQYSTGKTNEVVTIPVVVHIIHNGEPLGTGRNISDEQIISQIQVLNEDFRRQNTDQENTPSVFAPVAADTEIQFVLAQRDPEGLSTNGINRVNGGQERWNVVENYRMKQQSYWPAEEYLNIWVTDLGNNYLGYAQFPVSTLDGLDIASENATTDGVVVDYMVFGSSDIYPEANLISAYNLGRTATHEVGHFFGLRHLWGDGDCSEDDFVADTPTTGTSHSGLGQPCTFPGPNTCGSGPSDLPDMFQNYMDYTDDACMNLFTLDQKARMQVVLENSPRRKSLLTSKGGLPPVSFSNDAGIRSIPNQSSLLCNEIYLPEIEIRNYGTNTLTSVELTVLVNDEIAIHGNYPVSLEPLEIVFLTLETIELGVRGDYTITYLLGSVNGTTDNNPDNNITSFTSTLLPSSSGPLAADFENGLNDPWTTLNPDRKITWAVTTAPFQSSGNRALYMNFFDYELEGEVDFWVSPVIDLSNAARPELTFDLSHAPYPGSEDGLLITATNLCADPLLGSDTLFYKTGDDLSTVSGTTSEEFFPSGPSQWRNEILDLRKYTGGQVRISFIGINSYGNNLFLDNIHFDPGAIISLISPGLVSCGISNELSFQIQNSEETAITTFDIELLLNNTPSTYSFELITPLPPGESGIFTVENIILEEGQYLVEAEISNVNGSGTTFPGIDGLSEVIYINSDFDIVPFREDFNDNMRWTFASRDGMPLWNLQSTNYGSSAFLDFTTFTEETPTQWLVSQAFDLTGVTDPYLSFDHSYQRLGEETDLLSVLISTDCGESYSSLTSIELDLKNSSPGAPNDWTRELIPLSLLAGEEDIRIALVSNGRMGGRLYVDNIQLFINKPVVFDRQEIFPNPTRDGRFNVALNLEKRQNALLRIMDIHGKIVLVQELPNALNQTYPVDLSNFAAGIYLVEIRGETFSLIKRISNRR